MALPATCGQHARGNRRDRLIPYCSAHGYDAARATAAKAQVFVLLEARDPTLATLVHDIRSYTVEEVRFGMRYTDAVTTAEDGTRFWT